MLVGGQGLLEHLLRLRQGAAGDGDRPEDPEVEPTLAVDLEDLVEVGDPEDRELDPVARTQLLGARAVLREAGLDDESARRLVERGAARAFE